MASFLTLSDAIFVAASFKFNVHTPSSMFIDFTTVSLFKGENRSFCTGVLSVSIIFITASVLLLGILISFSVGMSSFPIGS